MQRRTDWRRTVTILPKHHPLCSRGNCPCHRMCHDTMRCDLWRKLVLLSTFKDCKVNPPRTVKYEFQSKESTSIFGCQQNAYFTVAIKMQKRGFRSTYRNQLSSYIGGGSILAWELLIPVGRFRTIRQQTVEQVGMNEWHYCSWWLWSRSCRNTYVCASSLAHFP